MKVRMNVFFSELIFSYYCQYKGLNLNKETVENLKIPLFSIWPNVANSALEIEADSWRLKVLYAGNQTFLSLII